MTLETFCQKFDQFADAPHAVVKMRQLVRALAVRGKLVPQNANDEPALAFLHQICTHKAALAKDGKLRGDNKVRPMPHEESDYELPVNWSWVRFGEIMVNRDGERIPVSKEERETKAKIYDYYGASGVIDKIDGYLFDKPLLLIGEDGANLISRSTPIAYIARGKYWVNNHAHVLDGISEDFLKFIELHINAINLAKYVTGSAQPKMNQAKMNSIPIALPPLAEQKRIVAKVDELMALCDRLEAQQQEREARHTALARASLARFANAPTPANLNFLFHKSYTIPPADLRKSILTLAVQGKLVPQDPKEEPASILLELIAQNIEGSNGNRRINNDAATTDEVKPFDLPPGWAWSRFPYLGEFSRGKSKHRPRNDRCLFLGGNHRLVQTGDVARANGTIETHTGLYNDVGLAQSKMWPAGTLCITIAANIADSGILGFDACFPDSIVGFIPAPPIPSVRYFEYFMRTAKEHLEEFAPATAQKNINLGILEQVWIPIPPQAEQRRIVAKVDQLMALVDALETQLAASHSTASNLLSALVADLTAT